MFIRNNYRLHNVTLESAIFLSGSTNNLAIGIEQCQCPSMYNGTSCQDPARGYYRYKSDAWSDGEQVTIERYIGQASPCQCNGRSNQCDTETGYCQVSMAQSHTDSMETYKI